MKNELGKSNVPLTVDTENAECMPHKDMWQNPQDKEETKKDNSAAVLNQLPWGKR